MLLFRGGLIVASVASGLRGVEIGVEVGVEVGVKIGVEIGVEIGMEIRVEIGAEIGVKIGAGGLVVAFEARRPLSFQPGQGNICPSSPGRATSVFRGRAADLALA